MTQQLSSFYFYLVDLWRRCFAKEYWVEAEKTETMSDGDEVATHNFRACPKCGRRIRFLDVKNEEARCGHRHENGTTCSKIIHKKGEYIDKKKERRFILYRSLYSKLFIMSRCFFVAGIIMGVFVFSVKAVPSGYEASHLGGLLWVWVIFSVWLPTIEYALTNGVSVRFIIKHPLLSGLGLIVMFSIVPVPFLLLGTDSVSGYSAAPFWETIPTQQQIYDQKYATLEAMPLDYKRFGFAQELAAKNPHIDLPKEFVQIAKVDFAGLVKAHGSYVFRLEYGSPEMQEFYSLYQAYLESLDTHDLIYQCQYDPWNLASGLAVQAYPKTWEKCLKK